MKKPCTGGGESVCVRAPVAARAIEICNLTVSDVRNIDCKSERHAWRHELARAPARSLPAAYVSERCKPYRKRGGVGGFADDV